MTIGHSRLAPALALAAATGLLAACAGGSVGGPAGGTTAAATNGAGSAVVGTAPPAGATAPASMPPAARAIEVCSLLTDADIKALTGYPVGSMNPAPMDTIFPSACEWKLEGTPFLIALGVESPGGQSAWDRLVPYTQGAPVSGIGDEAFHAEMGGDLMVRSGETFFDIQYVAPGEPKDVQDKLAMRVVDNLP